MSNFFSELLHAPITLEQDLFDAGATSFTLVQALTHIEQKYGVVVPVDLLLDKPYVAALDAYVAQHTSAQPVREPEAPSYRKFSQHDVTLELLAYFSDQLGASNLTADDDLFGAGMTSLGLVVAVDHIVREYGVDVPVELFLDTPTVAAIAAFLSSTTSASVSSSSSQNGALGGHNGSIENTSVGGLLLNEKCLREDRVVPSVPAEALASLLASLLEIEVDGDTKYLYPSAGGLNAVQTYVYLPRGGVVGWPEGTYYFHPGQARLYQISTSVPALTSLVDDYYHDLAQASSFAVCFVAKLPAITPIYGDLGLPIATLEAGYMTQLLLNHRADTDLVLVPIVGADYTALRALLQLDDHHVILAVQLGGASDMPALRAPPADLVDYLRSDDGRRFATRLRATKYHVGASVSFAPSTLFTPSLTRDTVEDAHRAKSYLREFPVEQASLDLNVPPALIDAYWRRACRREYDQTTAIAQQQLVSLIALAAAKRVRGAPHALLGRTDFQIYAHVKANRVEGLAEGLYRYDAQAAQLCPISHGQEATLIAAFTPFNRKHARAAAFTLFIVAQVEALQRVLGEAARNVLLLDAGRLGQTLIERQSEFELGLCPIGALRFDTISHHFGLRPGEELIHAFVGGRFVHGTTSTAQPLHVAAHAGAQALPREQPMALAILGASGRFPGAANLTQFWDNIAHGRSSLGKPSVARRKLQDARDDKARLAGYLDDVDRFDSVLFGISPAQAQLMDPQERLLLEAAWSCLENAGYTADALNAVARVGVFVGAMWSDYHIRGADNWMAHATVTSRVDSAALANRISYFFDFNGPSIVVNTACASALSALHLASASLRSGECDAALVGGVNVIAHSFHRAMLADMGMLASDDAARPLGAGATGLVIGEGVGMLLLRRLPDVDLVKDRILGLVRASVLAHTGRTSRFGLLGVAGQAQGLRRALDIAGIPATSIGYVETAAAGSNLGDAAEITALTQVFAGRPAEQHCVIGSVKGNIGHLESAAGISQMIKVLLQMEHRQIAPTLGSRPTNPLLKLKLEQGGMEVADLLRPWPVCQTEDGESYPLRAMVDVLSASGTLGHLVLEMPPARQPMNASGQARAIALSAASPTQLTELVESLREWLRASQFDATLDDVSFTLWTGRVALAERVVFVVRNFAELDQRLGDYLHGVREHEGLYCGSTYSGRGPHPADTEAQYLDEAAVRWASGGRFDARHIPMHARRVPLPTYPFAPMRHWLQDQVSALTED